MPLPCKKKIPGPCARCGAPIHVGALATYGTGNGRRGLWYHHTPPCYASTSTASTTTTTDATTMFDAADTDTASNIRAELAEETPPPEDETPPTDLEGGLLAALNAALAPTIEKYASKASAAVDADQVRDLITESIGDLDARILAAVQAKAPSTLTITVNDAPPVNVGHVHKMFPELVKSLKMGLKVYLAGPAGSGKTYAAEQAAKALDRPFYFDGRTDTDYKLLGYDHPTKGPTDTPFRHAYTYGGLYLADEIDGWENQACLAFQAALSNGACPFPGSAEPIRKHDTFLYMGAANTWGYGSDSQYVGRNKLDGAFLDRFDTFIPWDYDEELETLLTGNELVSSTVQRLRKTAFSKGMKIVISPRASFAVAVQVANGMSLKTALDRKILGRLPTADRQILEGVL